MNAIVYIHGKNGRADEAGRFAPLFPSCNVIGVDYKGSTPWQAGEEISESVVKLKEGHDRIILIANSIGAYFSMNADIEKNIFHAYFISPIADMEKLIVGMMKAAGISESTLREKGFVRTEYGEDLSWQYLCYVRENPVGWNVPTDILYGSEDHLTSIGTVTAFAQKIHASLTVMEGGGHWFHTDAEMNFLDKWLTERSVLNADF